jgi:peroxiredoxin Q/BCP
MELLEVGQNAPGFSVKSDTGETISLSDYLGKRVVLYFFPRADTPGCTTEACEFRDDHELYVDRDVVILGVSPDTVEDEAKFKAKYRLPFILLADKDHRISERYGVWGVKKSFGKEYMGVKRTTYLIDEEGRITHVFKGVRPKGHSEQVLQQLG